MSAISRQLGTATFAVTACVDPAGIQTTMGRPAGVAHREAATQWDLRGTTRWLMVHLARQLAATALPRDGPMRVRLLLMIIALLSSACGEPDEEDEAAPERVAPLPSDAPQTCGSPAGPYEVQLRQTSGNCGAQAGFIVDLPNRFFGTGGWAAACRGSTNRTANGCGYDLSVQCDNPPTDLERTLCTGPSTRPGYPDPNCSKPVTTTWRAITRWDPSLALGTGTWSMTRSRSELPCSSTYDVQIRQL